MSSSVRTIVRSAARSELSVTLRFSSSQAIGNLKSTRKTGCAAPLASSFYTNQRTTFSTTFHQFFQNSPQLQKKGGKSAKASKAEEAPLSNSKSSAPTVGEDDPYDYSSLESKIEKSHEKLKDELAKLRTGGRFNPEVLENVRVSLSKDSKETIKLGDLAQVIPKGRSVMVLVGEKDHVKPIVSAIQGSKDLNLQPQPDAHNPSQLNVQIPPPTKESRDAALGAANKAGENANLSIKNARAAMQKKLRAIEVAKKARPDDIKKAHKEMEKIVEKATAEAKKTVEAARQAMEQS